jgi:predicted TIM-barrel fold metal-dependent hydrolase
MSRPRLIDSDIHNDTPLQTLRPYLAREWHLWLDDGGPVFANRGVAKVGSGTMDDAVNEDDGLCAGDPEWVIGQLMSKYRIDVGILSSVESLASQRGIRFWTALSTALNDRLLDVWVRPHACFKGSIAVNAQDPEAAAREIHRVGEDPGWCGSSSAA